MANMRVTVDAVEEAEAEADVSLDYAAVKPKARVAAPAAAPTAAFDPVDDFGPTDDAVCSSPFPFPSPNYV